MTQRTVLQHKRGRGRTTPRMVQHQRRHENLPRALQLLLKRHRHPNIIIKRYVINFTCIKIDNLCTNFIVDLYIHVCTYCMQPKDKFVMELGKPASTKPPPSDSATATSSESNEMTVATPVKATSPTYEITVSTPIKATSPTSAPQLSISHVSKCTCTVSSRK